MADPKWDTSVLNSGERSALRCKAGIMMGNDMQAIEAFYRAAPKVPREKEEIWFACLCMECLWKSDSHPTVIPFEQMLRTLYQSPDSSASIKHRIISLLDVPWSRDGYLLGKLNNFARIFRSKSINSIPDFSALADDLSRWNHPDRFIQRQWIRTICSQYSKDENKDHQEMEETVNAH